MQQTDVNHGLWPPAQNLALDSHPKSLCFHFEHSEIPNPRGSSGNPEQMGWITQTIRRQMEHQSLPGSSPHRQPLLTLGKLTAWVMGLIRTNNDAGWEEGAVIGRERHRFLVWKSSFTDGEAISTPSPSPSPSADPQQAGLLSPYGPNRPGN